MQNSKLIQILHTFDESELKSLRKFIHSPYHNQHQDVISLYEYLVGDDGCLKVNLSKESVYQHLFPKGDYNDLQLRHVMSYLTATIEEFILIESVRKNARLKEIAKLKHFKSKNAIRQFEQTEKKWKRVVTEKQNVATVFEDFESNLTIQEFYVGQKRAETIYVQTVQEKLDEYYFIQKLRTACSTINQSKLYGKSIKINFLKPILNEIEVHHLSEHSPLIGLYYRSYQMLQNPSEENYHKSIEQIKDAIYHIDYESLKDGFLLCVNYCIQQINAGEQSYLNEIFKLYQFGIQHQLLLENRQLSYVTYSNTITVGLRLNKFDETLAFIEQNKHLLPQKYKGDYYIFNLTKYYFAKGQFEQVTQLYYQYNIKEILLNIQSRIIQIKAFYSLDEYELCVSLNDNLKQLLTRKGILAYHKENYKNVQKCLRLLLKVNPYDQLSKDKLHKQFSEIQPLTERDWLLEKLKELG